MKKLKKSYAIIITVVLVLVGLVFGYFVGIQEDFPDGKLLANPSTVEGAIPASKDEIIVKFKKDTTETEKTEINNEEGTKVEETIKATGAQVLDIPDNKDSHEVVAEFRQEYGDKIEYVELNGKMEPTYIPNDPGYKSQWALPKIQAPQGWDITKGLNSVTIAVLDTGVNINHPDLKNKIAVGYNVVDNNTDLTDLHGHGTLMMGIAGAQTNNLVGMAGVGIEPKIMMIRICNNAEGWAYWSDMAEAITYAADHGVKIVSISFGGSYGSSTVQNAINYAYSKGVFIAASAGNSGSNVPSYPAAYNHVVSVGATDSNDVKASWSNWGSWVDITSPGVSIYSTNKNGSYSSVSGTSPACPHVAALGALLLSKNATLNPDQIENYIEKYSDDLGSTGKDDIYGWGRINMYKALSAVSGPVPVPPKYGAITGKVTNSEDNAPIVGANVAVLKSGSTIISTKTLADGTYQFTNLAVGTYDINTSIAGFISSLKTNIQVVADETTSGVDFALQPDNRKGSISGTIYRLNNQPLYRAQVILKQLSTTRRANLIRYKVTRSDRYGRYKFTDVPEGTYVLLAQYRGQFGAKEVHILPGNNINVNLQLSKRNFLRWIKNILNLKK